MADRRPPQRPAYPRRGGPRPAARGPPVPGLRVSASARGLRAPAARGPPAPTLRPRRAAPASARPRRGKRVSGRFYVFLGIVALIIIAVVLLIWRPWASSPDPAIPRDRRATPAVMAPAADATIAPAADAQARTAAPRRRTAPR